MIDVQAAQDLLDRYGVEIVERGEAVAVIVPADTPIEAADAIVQSAYIVIASREASKGGPVADLWAQAEALFEAYVPVPTGFPDGRVLH